MALEGRRWGKQFAQGTAAEAAQVGAIKMAIRPLDDYAEFDCEGCGAHVYHYSLSEPPKHMFCATCLWLHETELSPEEFWALYKQMCKPPEPQKDA